ncbi:MAG: FAD binding domain-containing protein, partial [Eubacteriales bacterium]|nr:FAD binding domain-containing protein [Eubacteriales bacterium]
MLKIKQYVKVQSLEEAYELNQKKTSRVLGGMMWLRLSNRTVGTVIDLSGLGLDTIEETEAEFRIGCMTSLRTLETDERLNQYTNGAMRESLRHIVGVQFRNGATLGGSIFGRYGYSDVLTMFLALDTTVELYHAGLVPLTEFITMKKDRDILVRVIVKKTPICCYYTSQRSTATDFPVLTCAVSLAEETPCVVLGARPYAARRM